MTGCPSTAGNAPTPQVRYRRIDYNDSWPGLGSRLAGALHEYELFDDNDFDYYVVLIIDHDLAFVRPARWQTAVWRAARGHGADE